MKLKNQLLYIIVIIIFFTACQTPPVTYDLLITNAQIYDGLGNPPIAGSLAINADTLVAIGDLKDVKGTTQLDAGGKAVSPGFINMPQLGNSFTN